MTKKINRVFLYQKIILDVISAEIRGFYGRKVYLVLIHLVQIALHLFLC